MTPLIIFCAKYLIVLPPVIFLVYFWVARRRTKRKLLLLSLLALPAAYVVGKLAGYLHYTTRPFVEQGITPLIAHAADNGFPSDHTLLAATLASLVFVFNRRLGLLLWLLAIVIGGARVLAQVHHSVDIMASAAIAAAVVALVYVGIRSTRWYQG